MYFDYSKRDYLLPPGCKDLIDVLRLNQSTPPLWQQAQQRRPKPNPPVTHHVKVPDPISVKQLIEFAGRKPYCIIADLMQLGLFVKIDGTVSFDIAARVLRYYGIAAVPET
jgi:hypothetical protein